MKKHQSVLTNYKKSRLGYMLIIYLFIISIGLTSVAGGSEGFGVQITICRPYWYCTAYSAGNCGIRTCTDINSCGVNQDKPSEILACQTQTSASSGTSSSGGGIAAAEYNQKLEGYFTVNPDVIKMSVEQNKVVQKIIFINSSESKEYTIEIEYPSSYTKGTDFLTTTSSKKNIAETGDFNIIVDSRNILVGTYVVPIKIYNDKYSRKITAIIDVIPVKNVNIDLQVDSVIKTLGVDKEIAADINIKDAVISEGDNVTYYITDPKGNIVVSEEKTIDSKKSIETIKLPSDMEEGYYTLSMKISSASGTYTKSQTFTVLTPNKYAPVTQSPQNLGTMNILLIIGAIIIASILILAISGVLNKPYGCRHSRQNRWRLGIGAYNWGFKKGDIMNKFKKISQVFKLTKKDKEYKLEMLKNSYEKGFISLREYRDALKEQGFTVESQKVSDQYDKLRARERVEGIKKPESEKEKELQAKEQQKNAIEQAEAELLKQEAQLKKEIEEEKRQKEALDQEKARNEERAKALEKQNEEKLREQESLETERAKKQREEHDNQMLIQETNILSKDNILDTRAGNDQAFVMNNNEKLYSIRDLLNALQHTPEHVIHHHTKYGRNDFANWIGDVFHYYDVAEEIRKVTDKEDLIKILKKYD